MTKALKKPKRRRKAERNHRPRSPKQLHQQERFDQFEAMLQNQVKERGNKAPPKRSRKSRRQKSMNPRLKRRKTGEKRAHTEQKERTIKLTEEEQSVYGNRCPHGYKKKKILGKYDSLITVLMFLEEASQLSGWEKT